MLLSPRHILLEQRNSSAASLARGRRSQRSQPRVHRLAFQSEDAENALVHTAERLPAHESLQTFNAQSELAHGQRAFRAQPTAAKPREILVCRILGAVDDPQI